jgi:hypothetical protein
MRRREWLLGLGLFCGVKTRKVAAAVPARLEDLTLEATVPLRAPMDHVQGIAVRGSTLWATSVERRTKRGYLHEFRLLQGEMVRQVELQRGDVYHPGGIDADDESIWIPVAEYRAHSRSVIERRNQKTLALMSEFAVPDHIGCVAAAEGRLWGGNWDARILYEWRYDGTSVRKSQNPTGTSYQDLKWVQGDLVGGGLRGGGEGAVDWLDPESLALRRRLTAGKTDRGVTYTHEGMAIHQNRLYLLPEDGPESRLFVFRLG